MEMKREFPGKLVFVVDFPSRAFGKEPQEAGPLSGSLQSLCRGHSGDVEVKPRIPVVVKKTVRVIQIKGELPVWIPTVQFR